jgi:hypothetical protein
MKTTRLEKQRRRGRLAWPEPARAGRADSLQIRRPDYSDRARPGPADELRSIPQAAARRGPPEWGRACTAESASRAAPGGPGAVRVRRAGPGWRSGPPGLSGPAGPGRRLGSGPRCVTSSESDGLAARRRLNGNLRHTHTQVRRRLNGNLRHAHTQVRRRLSSHGNLRPGPWPPTTAR